MLALLLFIGLVVLGAAFAAGYAFAVYREGVSRARRGLAPAPDSAAEQGPEALELPPVDEPTRVAFTALAPEGTPEWRSEMADLGERLRAAGVRLVVFVHGSFVGDDPLSIARTLDGAFPAMPDLARAVRGFTRTRLSGLLGDLSNFPPEYVRAFAAAAGVESVEFVWSGQNHHAARVQEAVRLARALVLHRGGALAPDDRVLLVSHSHGGQLAAVLSQLVGRVRGYEELVGAAAARGEDVDALEGDLAILRRCAFDVATFGTPPRYGWATAARFRVLHVVNHRGPDPQAGSLRGLLHTRRGDYIHHLGAAGSDWPAPAASDRAINARLDRVLGAGAHFRTWLHNVARGVRVAPHGHTVLVDYGDQGALAPNFWSTGFGHAAYTRREAMLFHMRLVANHFYPPRDPSLTPRDAALKAPRLLGWIAPLKLLPPRRRLPSSPDA